jgi:hypothetical protein
VRIEFTFSRDADYFRRLLLPTAGVRTRVLRNAALLASTVGATLAAAFHDRAAGLTLGSVLVLAGVAALFARHRWIVKMITVPASWHSPRRWLLTADGLESDSELTSATHAWSTFRSGHVRDDAYLLIQGGPVIIDIPRLPLTAEQDTELNAFLQERGILGPAARQ